jgi:subtilisin family serine protease
MSKKVFSVISLLLVFVFITSVTQPAYSSNEGKMRVWVEFSPGSAARVEKSLQGMGAEFHYRFEDLNSFVVTVPEQAIAGLRNNPNVNSIEEDAIRYPAGQTVPYGIDLVQARDVWDANRDGTIDTGAPTGSGIKVCIIDSGLYTDHEDFAGVSVNGFSSNWNTDTCGHGTHVAGTIAALFNSLGVVGVTPGGAELYIVKVFDGPECGWTYSSTLADAANKCGAADADIISMSLGGTVKNRQEQLTFDALYSQGILSIAAAGNGGNTRISYPGGYSSVMSVAAIDENMAIADFSQQNSTVEIAAPGVGVLSTVPYINVANLTIDGVDYSVNQMEYAELGSVSGPLANGGICDSVGSWSGAVVLCERGTNDFVNKVQNVQAGGGKAAVIYNNAPGNFLGTLGEDGLVSIPAVSLSQEDGQYLVANKLGVNAEVSTASTSPASGYEAWDGTSMATPHVSGVAALVWSANKDWTNAEIREALTASALDLGAAGRDVAYGYGLVQAADALAYLGGVTPPPPPPPVDKAMTLTVTALPDIVTNNKTVTITVTATDKETGVPVSEANVSVLISIPGKELANLNGTTNTSGVATFSYRVKTRTTGYGDINVNTTATKDGYQLATAETTFNVQ